MDKLICTKYQISDQYGMRLALISDLHDRDSKNVLGMLQTMHPDMILICGDLMERCEEGISEWTQEKMDEIMGAHGLLHTIKSLLKHSFLYSNQEGREYSYNHGREFLKEASKIAPIYYSIGNHEWYFTKEDEELFRQCQIHVLDNEDIEIGTLRIGGYSTRFSKEWLESYRKKDGDKILLCHHPEYVLRDLKEGTDAFFLILSGHAHGGQWRIGNRGLYAPGQGIFAKYVHGIYQGNWIVSSGCANTVKVPRFFNPCEVVMIEI